MERNNQLVYRDREGNYKLRDIPLASVLDCSACHRRMVLRVNRKTGGPFIGCKGFPLCRETLEVYDFNDACEDIYNMPLREVEQVTTGNFTYEPQVQNLEALLELPTPKELEEQERIRQEEEAARIRKQEEEERRAKEEEKRKFKEATHNLMFIRTRDLARRLKEA